MVRKKQSNPRKGRDGFGETQSTNLEGVHNVSTGSSGGHEDGKGLVADNTKLVYVAIDSIHNEGKGTFYLAEVILCDVQFGEGMSLERFVDKNVELSLRLKLCMSQADNVRVGYWPVIPAKDVALEFLVSAFSVGFEENTADERSDSSPLVLAEGHFDGTDEGVSGLAHLISQGLLTLRMTDGLKGVDPSSSCRIQIVITKKAFDVSHGLSGSLRQPWRKSMMNVMSWLRPEVVTDEAIYGPPPLENRKDDSDPFAESDAMDGLDNHFDTTAFYEAIKTSKQEPMLEVNFQQLLPELRPYQRRASYWMVQRERCKIQDGTAESQQGNIPNPLCVAVYSSDIHSKMFYNPFSGSVSRHPEGSLSRVPGGILADEMGLGKTVELLACIVAHPQKSAQAGSVSRKKNTRKNGTYTPLKRPKIERVECICGAVTESNMYIGLWVQCDICDAWQHGDCVGFRTEGQADVERTSRKLSSKRRKVSMLKYAADVMDAGEEFMCNTCSELLQIAGNEVVSHATLIVCPASILQQWWTEIARHTKKGSLKVQVYKGVKDLSTHSLLETMGITINELANADIVLTTYDVLKSDLSHDSDRHHGDRRSMRFEKRYPVIPTPLTKIHWWRLCLDEAQMVESNTTAATEMAMRLSAQNLWCVTGTPIQRNLEDMYGLLRFLRAEPFDDHRWWSEVIKIPYERGNVGAIRLTHEIFRQLMWRSTKSQVSDELKLPPQEERLTWLTFSPIEAHFYKRQHESCAASAREFIAKCKDDICNKSRGYPKKSHVIGSQASYDSHLTHREASKLLNSLLKLRQACCHPQVGSSGLRSLQQTPMTMEEILQVLISKAKTEGEESLRKLVVALNGMAALAIIEKNLSHAASLYREALKIAEEHQDDFRLDPLLNLHSLHNLAEIISVSSNPNTMSNSEGDKILMGSKRGDNTLIESGLSSYTIPAEQSNPRMDSISTEDPRMVNACSEHDPQLRGVPRTLRDDSLMKQCDIIKEKYMLQFTTKLATARNEFRSSYSQVIEAMQDFQYVGRENWWLVVLDIVEKKNLSKDLMDKIRDNLSETDGRLNSSRLGQRFKDASGLKYIVKTGLDALENSRKALVDRLMIVDKMTDNPADSDIERIRSCSNCYRTNSSLLCLHCEMDELFQVYGNRLFMLRTGEDVEGISFADEALNLQKHRSALNRFFGGLSSERDRINNHDSGINTVDKNGRQRQHKGHIQVARLPSELEVILNVIKSFLKTRLSKDEMSAAKKHMLIFEAMRKEFTQARSLSVAQAQVMRAYDELKMAISRLRLRLPGEDTAGVETLCEEELVPTCVQLTGEKFVALAELSRMKGQLRYLKGLSLAKQRHRVEGITHSDQMEEITNNGSREVTNGRLDPVVSKNCDETCPVCHEKLDTKFMVFPCGHLLCCKCMVTMVEMPSPSSTISQRKHIMCPTCRHRTDFRNVAYVDDGSGENSYGERINEVQDDEKDESSIIVQGSFGTKMESVTRRILWIKSVDPEAKILVFSCWKDVLDVLEHSLRVNDISFVRMKGGSNSDIAIKQFKGMVDQGEQSVRQQKKQQSPQVLLLLFRHGANGLNLLEARHVILVEPLLNPAAEAQAINRVHRIGQEHKTFVHRFIVRETVEESIYKLNRSKPVNLSGTSCNMRKQDQFSLTLKDIDSLFASNELEKSHDGGREDLREVHPMRNLRDLPPAVAAAVAAENRLRQASNDGT